MPAGKIARMVVANTLRSPRHFILSAFGIVIGIGAFVLFLALTQRVGSVVEKVFPLDEVQVVAPTVALGTLDATKRIDQSTVDRIKLRHEVAGAIPRMNMAFPGAGHGKFEGKTFGLELGGFVDGVDASFVQDDARIQDLFRDWDALKDDPNRIACVPPPPDPDEPVLQSPPAPKGTKKKGSGAKWDQMGSAAPATATETPGKPPAIPPEYEMPPPGQPAMPKAWREHMRRQEELQQQSPPAVPAATGAVPATSAAPPSLATGGSAAPATGSAAPPAGPTTPGTGTATVVSQTLPPYENPCPNPDRYYCDDTERICKHRVPVALSATVVELYNTRFAKANGMPAANKDLVNFLIQSRGLSAMRFSIGLNNTVLAGGGTVSKKQPRRVEAVIVGVSTRALQLGVTVPIQYIERWNREYLGDDAATRFSSIIVKLRDRDQIAPFSQWLKDAEDLRIEESLGERFATVIFVIRILFLIISVAILVVAVINIGHNFFVQVSERRREIGIMRAVGATELDVLLIVLGEAAMVGIVGGVLGVGLAVGLGSAWDAIAVKVIPNFPFRPDSWFAFKPWIWGSALGFSTLFCILGGYLPARRAAKMQPAQALAQN